MSAVGAPQPNKTPPTVVPPKAGKPGAPGSPGTQEGTGRAEEKPTTTGAGTYTGGSGYVSASDPYIEMLSMQFLQTRLEMIENLEAAFKPSEEELEGEKKYQEKKDLKAKADKIFYLCQQTKAAIAGLIAVSGSSNKGAIAGDLQRIAALVSSLSAEVKGLQGDIQNMDSSTFSQLQATGYKDVLFAASKIKGVLDDVAGVIERKSTSRIDYNG